MAPKLRHYPPEILADSRLAPGTNLIEGINDKIKTTKRIDIGFRDDANAVLETRQCSPELRAVPKNRPPVGGQMDLSAMFNGYAKIQASN